MNFKPALVLLMISLIIGCNKKDNPVNPVYFYSAPVAYNDDLEVSTLESEGLDVTPIRGMMDYINSIDQHRIHNILIIKNNKLVFEEYFQGYALSFTAAGLDGPIMQYTRETDHYMASVTKSVTSVITGVAINRGLIPDLNKKIIDYFPEYEGIMTGEKANITIQHLLTMRVGLEYDENTYPYTDSRSDTYKMMHSSDPIEYVLSKPIASTPGTQFHYNTGSTNVVATIIEKESGMQFFDYANEYFFDAMNIQGGKWIMLNKGLPMASGGLYLRARELCKIGLLFLNDGMWQEKQYITSEWINDSQYAYIASTGYLPNTAYGYQWWITHFTAKGTSYKCFFAAGWGDQYLFIIPELEMIIEFNGGNYLNTGSISPINLVTNYILKAVN